MSLILEALKKLDREKQAPDRGVVVVGPAAWASPGDSRFPVSGGLLVVGALVLGGAAGAVWNARRPGPPAASSPSAATQPPSQTAPAMTSPPAAVGATSTDGRPLGAPPIPTSASRSRVARGAAPAADVAKTDAPATAASDPAQPAEPGDQASRETEAAATPAAEAPAEVPARKPARHGAPPDFELQAISAQNGHPVAVLNDRLVQEGDTFDNVRVLRIGADEVEIEVAGHRRIVKF